MTQKPHLFYEATGQKLADNELVPKNSRLEYNVIAQPTTTMQGGSGHGGGYRNEMQGERMASHEQRRGQKDQHHTLGGPMSNDPSTTTQISASFGSGGQDQNGGGGHGFTHHSQNERHQKGGGAHPSRYGMGGAGHNNYTVSGAYLSPNFLCERCKVPGHYIRDCPRNGDPLYNPSQRKGIPTTHLWRSIITPEEFQKARGLVHKSLMKQKEIYDFSEIVTSKENASVEATLKAQADDETSNAVIFSTGPGGLFTDLPPSLKCQLCSNLIESATMTPCCFSSCCYECLKSYLTSSHRLASSRAGVCPIAHCREQDIFVQDLIPNHALNKAADWFVRQRISLMDQVTIEIAKDEKPI